MTMRESQNIEVLILVGGFGTRLREVVRDVPKPMAPINGIPFLEILVKKLKKEGFQNICLLTGYLAQVIENHFGDGSTLGLNIRYSNEDTPLGTGGAIRQAIEGSSYDHFMILNGDTFFAIKYRSFVNESFGEKISIALKLMLEADRYGTVEIDPLNLKIKKFIEKTKTPNSNLINAGVYFCTREIINIFPVQSTFSLEADFLSVNTEEKKIKAIIYDGEFIDIGIPNDYKRAQELNLEGL